MKVVIFTLLWAYVIVCALAFIFQNRLVFFPSREVDAKPSDAGLDFEDVDFDRPGAKLHGWFVPAADPRFTLLYCHGNAGNISDRLESLKLLNSLGLSVFIFDYAGYGRSSGRPTEKGTYADARAAWRYLTETRGVSPDDIILFGRSLGGAIAIELATEVRPRAVILESCFTSAPELATRAYPWLPVKLLARIRYNSYARVDAIGVPKLFVHSTEDEVVPYGMGRRLFNRAVRPKQFVKIRGGHNDGPFVTGEKYVTALDAFLENVVTRASRE